MLTEIALEQMIDLHVPLALVLMLSTVLCVELAEFITVIFTRCLVTLDLELSFFCYYIYLETLVHSLTW